MTKKKKNNSNKEMEFSDIMSRSDKKNLKKFLFEEDENIEQGEEDINLINKKFDDELNKEKQKNKIYTDKKENNQDKKKEPKNICLIAFASISLVLSIAYLLFNILFCKDQINNIFLIINASIITFFTLFLMLMVSVKGIKAKNILGIFTTLILSIFIIFNFLVISNIIDLPTQELLENFQNKTISEALKWAKENNIEVNQIYEYSDNIEEYHIISQDVYPNTLLKNVSEITFTVSYGPNYDKIVSIPNMVGWNIDDAVKTINDNFLNNVTVEYEVNNEEKKDIILEQTTSGQIRRNDELKLKVSLGPEDELEPVDMINLQNKSLFEATLWLKRHGIKYEIVYVFSDNVTKNYVVDSETEEGTTVDPKKDTVKLIVSKGKKIVVPDLTKMTVDELTEWIIENNLKVKFDTKYDSLIEVGKIIEADYHENDEIESGTLITVITSKGPLKMPSFNNLSEFRTWANTIGINYREEYEFNDKVANGDIIKTIPEADTVINYSDTLVIHISYGKPVTIPSFIGKHRDEISTTCSNIGLNCTFYYNGYSDTPNGIAQNQNKNAGAEVVAGTYVSIGLSSGPAPTNNDPQPPANQCTSNTTHRLRIQQDWVTGGSAQATINTLQQKLSANYPNVIFHFKTKPGNLPSGFIHEESEYTNNSQIQDCNEYTIIINE